MLARFLSGDRPDSGDGRLLSRPVPVTLEPGDWVEVRPFEEIAATLDAERRCGGLHFMPEMESFCGRRFRVMKPARTIKLESTGEVRRLSAPAVLLEGVYCDGARHRGCDRACLHIWRGEWLEPVAAMETVQDPRAPAVAMPAIPATQPQRDGGPKIEQPVRTDREPFEPVLSGAGHDAGGRWERPATRGPGPATPAGREERLPDR